MTLYDSNASNYIRVITGTAVPIGQMNHIAMTYDGSKSTSGIKIYLNKVLQTNSNSTSGTYIKQDNVASNLNIGHHFDRARAGWHDEYKFWDKLSLIESFLQSKIRNQNDKVTAFFFYIILYPDFSEITFNYSFHQRQSNP